MKVYNKVVIDMSTLKVVEEDSFEYHGPIAHCGGGGGDGGYDDVGPYGAGGLTGEEFSDLQGESGLDAPGGPSDQDFDAGIYGSAGPTGNPDGSINAEESASPSTIDAFTSGFGDGSGELGGAGIATDEEIQADATNTINEKAKGALAEGLTKPATSPLGLLVNVAKSYAEVDLTPAEQAIYDAQIADANAAESGDSGQVQTNRAVPTQRPAPPPSETAEVAANVDRNPGGEAVTPEVEEQRKRVRGRRGFASNLLTSPLGVLGRANIQKRSLLRLG
jgi:hypothetical protein